MIEHRFGAEYEISDLPVGTELSATNEAVRASGKAGRPGNVAEGRRVGRVEIV